MFRRYALKYVPYLPLIGAASFWVLIHFIAFELYSGTSKIVFDGGVWLGALHGKITLVEPGYVRIGERFQLSSRPNGRLEDVVFLDDSQPDQVANVVPSTIQQTLTGSMKCSFHRNLGYEFIFSFPYWIVILVALLFAWWLRPKQRNKTSQSTRLTL